MDILVGNTGFVGSNIKMQHSFQGLYHSSNISSAWNTQPDLCVYAGVTAKKYVAQAAPKQDQAIIDAALYNIQHIHPQKLILISTVDVYPVVREVYEDTPIPCKKENVYGYHRYELECKVRECYPDCLIVRLPALFGHNLKKNFLYDLIHIIPPSLTTEKYNALSQLEPLIGEAYCLDHNGFYQCKEETKELKQAFLRTGFSSLNFTDSEAYYQFYPLSHLWEHIQMALHENLTLLNLAVEPIKAEEIYSYLYNKPFHNPQGKDIFYDMRTRYDQLLGGENGYLFHKEKILQDIKMFVTEQEQQLARKWNG